MEMERHTQYLEKRARRRYTVGLSIIVRWNDGGHLAEARASTENVNSRGVYFKISLRLVERCPVEIVMALPGSGNSANFSKVRCRGNVVRIEPDGKGVCVAVVFDNYEFLRRLPAPA
jgi:hypothetical protein